MDNASEAILALKPHTAGSMCLGQRLHRSPCV
jgi:hypothetical protein